MRSANKLQGMGCTNEHNRDWRALETDHYKDAEVIRRSVGMGHLAGRRQQITTLDAINFGTTRVLV